MKKLLLATLLTLGLTGMCTSCGSEEHHHSYGAYEVTVKPTCTTEGKRVKKCKECGHEVVETIPATGHNFVNGECTECGEKEVK